MSLFRRVQQSVEVRIYKFVSTEQLISWVRTVNHQSSISILIALKERLAHQDGTLAGVDLSNARLNHALLSSCHLSNTSFADGQLVGIYFAYSDLSNANLSGANLTDAHCREADLSHVNLSNAILHRTNFARADLNHSDLTSADLTDANLWRANLCGANLTDANLTNANLSDVEIDEITILPNGNQGHDKVDWSIFTTAN